MSDDIVKLVDHCEDNNRMISLEDALVKALEDVRSGEVTANRMLVLFVTDDEEQYLVGWRAANISCSQMLSALEVTKYIAIDEMGYAP